MADEPVNDRGSSLRIDVTLSIGYTRRRANITDRWEMRFDSIGLLIAGAIVTLVILLVVLPRILALF